jgi:hypothetical protein
VLGALGVVLLFPMMKSFVKFPALQFKRKKVSIPLLMVVLKGHTREKKDCRGLSV